MTSKLTIRDIARLAGVSKSTVSRVLNAHPKVDPETRERVLSVMKEHGFVPNAAATGLAKGRGHLIGLLVPALTWELVSDVLQGAASVLEDSRYDIIIYSASPDKDFSQVIDRILAANMVAGILALLHTQSPRHLVELHRQGLPIVLINHVAARVDLPQVGIDNVAATYEAVRHLLALGHRRIGFILGLPEIQCTHDRYEGYHKALSDAGVSLDPSLVLQGDYRCEGGYASAQKFFTMAEPPTAIFASNDLTAYGVLDAAQKYEVRVPEDVALVGFDDIAPSIHVHPALTTIHHPFKEMGSSAAHLLLSMINTDNSLTPEEGDLPVPDSTEQGAGTPRILLPTHLVVRESCGAAQGYPIHSPV
ncbi:MAG TPA: LacI family DNA-binding transcriptional regulator [Ktedonobacteraceae bacterium]|nr:LacI family DNA-binding transcriptional regulator [Ktedonobacteraceae bacterium]